VLISDYRVWTAIAKDEEGMCKENLISELTECMIFSTIVLLLLLLLLFHFFICM
jgi:hypothetical protein